ncbi:MAG: NAD(+)/NADH kinase [Candidatus Thorarchaeota archaeon]
MSIESNPQILSEKRAVGLVCKPGRKDIEKTASLLVDELIRRNIRVLGDRGSCSTTHDKVEVTDISDMDVDFVITIGGDGTILYTLGQLPDRETPLFCVNKGTVGFMTESSTNNAVSSLKEILEGNCIIESNINITSGVGKQRFEDALNEVYVVSRVPGRLLTFDVRVDGVQVDYGRADGAMVATPTGSSAYALAAGGSILTPRVHGLIFVPVCPPRFELKSMIFPDDSSIEMELAKIEAPGLAVIDGQTQFDVESGEVVWVKKSEGVTRFVRLSDNYYHRLNTRLVPRTQQVK